MSSIPINEVIKEIGYLGADYKLRFAALQC
jgi:hypothetical protein